MDLDTLRKRLLEINEKLSGFEVDPKTNEYWGLVTERSNLSKKISKLEWATLTYDEKQSTRNEDFSLTCKYYEKYGEEVEREYQSKKKYIDLINEVVSLNIGQNPVLQILCETLNLSIYLDPNVIPYLDIIMNQLKQDSQIDTMNLLRVYNELLEIQQNNYPR